MTRVVVACGALALHINAIARRRGWELEVRALPPELEPVQINARRAEVRPGDWDYGHIEAPEIQRMAGVPREREIGR